MPSLFTWHGLLRSTCCAALGLGLFTTAPPCAQGQPQEPNATPGALPAADTEAAPGPPSPQPPQPSTVLLHLENHSEVIGDADFYAALSSTLGRPLQFSDTPGAMPGLPLLGIVYSPERGELSVSYSAPGQSSTTRVVEAPVDPVEVPEAAALLAANLLAEQVNVPQPAPTAPAAATPPLTVTPAAVTPQQALAAQPLAPQRLANAGLFYPLAANYGMPELKTHFEFNVLYGLIGELDGLSLGTLSVVQGSVRGMQLALLANAAGGHTRGVQLAFAVNSAQALDVGFQVAGVGNYSAQRTRGAQVALGANFTAGALWGGQASLLGNYSAGSVTGLQAAGLLNLAGNLRGAQAALFNRARDVQGVQVGLLNLARNVRGAQIGLVNLSHDSDGVALGLVNVSQSAGVHLSAWTSSTQHANLGLRMATPYTFTLLSLGYHHDPSADALGAGLTLGGTVPLTKRVSFDVDVGADYLIGTRLCCYETRSAERRAHGKDRSHLRLRFVPTWQVSPMFALFAGAGVAARVPFALYSNFRAADRSVRLVPELLAGVSL